MEYKPHKCPICNTYLEPYNNKIYCTFKGSILLNLELFECKNHLSKATNAITIGNITLEHYRHAHTSGTIMEWEEAIKEYIE